MCIKNSNVVDNHWAMFDSEDEFYGYVEERNSNAIWLPEMATNELKFEPIDCSFTAMIDGKAKEYQASDDAYKDTILGTKLAIIDGNGGKHLMRLNALNQAKQRLCIEGSVFNSFSPEQTALVLNTACAVNKKPALLRVADEKLTGWLSAKSYAIIDSSEVYKVGQEAMTSIFGKAPKFRKAYYSHTFMDAIYDIDEDKKEMRDIIDRYRDIIGDDYEFCVSFSTSDTGNSSITIDPRLVKRDCKVSTIPCGGTLRVPHKGDKTMENLREQFNMLAGALTKGVEMIEHLKQVHVQYSAQVLMRAMKKVQLPANESMQIVMKWDAMHHDQPADALQLYMVAQEVALNVALEENNPMKTYRIEDALGRMLGINWSAFDYPGDLAWS